MSCCGQTAQQALAAAQQTLNARTAALTHVRLVYTGQDKRVRPFVAVGKIYQFGNNERRRTNVVAAAAVQKLMAMGLFEVFDPERHNEDGSERRGAGGEGQGTSMSDPGLPIQPDAMDPAVAVTNPQPTETPQIASTALTGEMTSPAAESPANAPPAQPATKVVSLPQGRKK